ncbi:MAG: 1-acyl-sn-glycerol-3-phosphate acyltransferase [Chitinophagaceae bacterium]|nr:1-acyl-sn-glycerol-3-phosphate acyltransferase [Chitinophagaceae bacterium]MCW5928725.1 1-acyl-sn-glycerol-3-phosphate acyltransferase [Chitinophagaceae bacterium]
MKVLVKLSLWLYNLYALLVFIALMLLVFPFVILASFLGNIRGGNMIYRLCMFWADTWFLLVGIRHRNIYESPVSLQKSYLYVSNHISFLDAAIIVKSYRRPVRPLGRKETTKIPVFGYIYKKAIITVDRGDTRDRANSVRILKSVLKKGISILIFPEGTFNETHQPLKSFYDGAFRIAIETQTPIRPVLFLDTFKRMHYRSVLSLTPGRSRSVFLDEIPVEGLTLSDVAALKQRTFELMEQKLRQYKAEWIRENLEA